MIRALPLCIAAIGLCLASCNVVGAISRGDTATRLADTNSSIGIRARMSRAEGFFLGGVDIEVTDGVALLSGRVPRAEDRVEAERIAWTGDNIREVANEIVVGEGRRLGTRTDDEITAQAVRTALLGSSDVRSINFNVEVANGVCYLLGVARTAEELDRAASIAAGVRGVERVVTYVRIEGQPAQ
jgi:osmotically-inducible protein OsmY